MTKQTVRNNKFLKWAKQEFNVPVYKSIAGSMNRSWEAGKANLIETVKTFTRPHEGREVVIHAIEGNDFDTLLQYHATGLPKKGV